MANDASAQGISSSAKIERELPARATLKWEQMRALKAPRLLSALARRLWKALVAQHLPTVCDKEDAVAAETQDILCSLGRVLHHSGLSAGRVAIPLSCAVVAASKLRINSWRRWGSTSRSFCRVTCIPALRLEEVRVVVEVHLRVVFVDVLPADGHDPPLVFRGQHPAAVLLLQSDHRVRGTVLQHEECVLLPSLELFKIQLLPRKVLNLGLPRTQHILVAPHGCNPWLQRIVVVGDCVGLL
mmetsp:Transcript_78546/g.199857  ORF Transcript_78546/g.199857 Transcript_78546/m.199857 type:complete len:242 (+) Transcript_78546:143-868(+)